MYKGNTNTFEGRVFVTPSTVSSLAFYVANAFPNLSTDQVNQVVTTYQGVPGLPDALSQAIAVQGECEQIMAWRRSEKC